MRKRVTAMDLLMSHDAKLNVSPASRRWPSDDAPNPLPAASAGQALPSPVAGPFPDGTDHEQAARIEMLGTMATGVAHEFNNLLTIVLASLHRLRRQPLDEHGRELLERADWGVRQAGRLTGQMLSFARRENSPLQLVDLNDVLGEFDKMVGHAAGYGTGLRLKMELAAQGLPVRLDPGQLELALLNLVRNAADSMSGNGSISIRTSGHCNGGLDGQPLVEVSVSDTGTGMPPEVVQRATNPFFTTKEPGHGTGLGLWMVQRFLAACDGKLNIETACGEGTTVRLVFPRADAE
jgi:signal transduction histidine kinase